MTKSESLKAPAEQSAAPRAILHPGKTPYAVRRRSF